MSSTAKSALKLAMPAAVTCLVAGTILAILAPYGTHSFSLSGRFSFWVELCFAGGFGACLTDVRAKQFNIKLAPWPRVFAQSITATFVVTLAMILMDLSIGGAVTGAQIALLFFYVWVISITISTVGHLLARTPTIPQGPPRPALFERLPMHLRNSEIHDLSAEDHYVRIITSKGEEMILIRLSDAIKEVTPLDGPSPHRSWWVAAAGVEKLTKADGKSVLILKSGKTVPISRNGMKEVRAAGWS